MNDEYHKLPEPDEFRVELQDGDMITPYGVFRDGRPVREMAMKKGPPPTEKTIEEQIVELLHWQGNPAEGREIIKKIRSKYARSIEIENGQINFLWSRRETYALMLVLSWHELIPFYPSDGFRSHPELTKSLTTFIVEECTHKGAFVCRNNFLASAYPSTGKLLGDTVKEMVEILSLPRIPSAYISKLNSGVDEYDDEPY